MKRVSVNINENIPQLSLLLDIVNSLRKIPPDAIIICKDGLEVPFVSVLVYARCDLFKSMYGGDNPNQVTIHFESIDQIIMQRYISFLQFGDIIDATLPEWLELYNLAK